MQPQPVTAGKQAKPSALAAFARLQQQQTPKTPEQSLVSRPNSIALKSLDKPAAQESTTEQEAGNVNEKSSVMDAPEPSESVETEEREPIGGDVNGKPSGQTEESAGDDDFIVLDSDDELIVSAQGTRPVENSVAATEGCLDKHIVSAAAAMDLYDDVAPASSVQPPVRERY